MPTSWVLFTYKVPPEPAKKRVAMWRRLKGLGAVYLNNGVCLLPKTDEHLRHLKIMENDVSGMGGEAVLLETIGLDHGQEDKVMTRFRQDRDAEYQEFIDKCADFERELCRETTHNHFTYAELEENDADLNKLQAWLEKIKKLDFYAAPLRDDAEKRFRECQAKLEGYAQRVFDAHDENK
jgi:hypothetical protein